MNTSKPQSPLRFIELSDSHFINTAHIETIIPDPDDPSFSCVYLINSTGNEDFVSVPMAAEVLVMAVLFQENPIIKAI